MNEIVKLLKQTSPLSENTEDVSVSEVIKRIDDRPESVGTWINSIRSIAKGELSEKDLYPIYDKVFYRMQTGYNDADETGEIYSVLEEVSGACKSNLYPDTKKKVKGAMLYLVTSPQNIQTSIRKISHRMLHDVEILLIETILDIYIPSDSYFKAAKYILPEHGSCLLFIMDMAYNIDELNKLKDELEAQLKESLSGDYCDIDYFIQTSKQTTDRLFRYIWDLFSKRETRIEFLMRYHQSLKATPLSEVIEQILDNCSALFDRREMYYAITEILWIIDNFQDYQVRIQRFLLDSFAESNADVVTNQKLAIFLTEVLNILLPYLHEKDEGFTEDTISHMADGLYAISKTRELYNNRGENALEAYASIDIAMELSATFKQKAASKTFSARNKISNAFSAFSRGKEQVEQQLDIMMKSVRNGFKKSTRTELIEGKEFSMISILKKALKTSAIFSYSKIGGLAYLIVSKVLKDKRRSSERKKLLLELEEEMTIIDEKIEDARSDGNRDAKYNLIRTKAGLKNAYDRLKYGLEADDKAKSIATNLVTKNFKANMRR